MGYIALGGKIEPGETELDCLHREVQEEIGCRVKNAKHFATFEGPNHDHTKTLRMTCYLCDLEGEPRVNPEDSIDHFTWISKDYKDKDIAHMLRASILPELIKRGLL